MSASVLLLAALEVIVQCDTWDYGAKFDIQTVAGNEKVLDHIAGVAPDVIAWRVNGGSLQQFDCREELRPRGYPPRDLDLRRTSDSRWLNGWLRLAGEWDGGIDLLKTGMELIGKRGLVKGAYMPFEENHFYLCKIGYWNYEHPQYWSRMRDGSALMTRCSLAYPEVREHKLRIFDEVLAYGPDLVYTEVGRTGTWTAADEYVKPNVETWKRLYPGEPLPLASDERWLKIVGEAQYAYFKGMRERIDRTGRKVRLLLGLYGVSATEDPNWRLKAVDWKRLARERIVDGIVLGGVFPDWSRPLESTRELYERVKKDAAGRDFYVPVSIYRFHGAGIPTYAKEMGISNAEAGRHLMRLAKEVGAKGVLLECVDYGNYSPDLMQVIREEK